MADNTQQGGLDLVATDELVTINGVAAAGEKVQRVKVGYGVDGDLKDVSATTPLPIQLTVASNTSTRTSVAASVTVVTLLAINTNRRGATVHNDSTAILYLALGSGASTSSFTVKIPVDGYYEVPFGYLGIITAVWASAAGSARVTELT